jgi:hypothetical protein
MTSKGAFDITRVDRYPLRRMDPQRSARPVFTLRFRDETTHQALRLTADLLGMSMNELAENAIRHELTLLGADLEQRLIRATELLRSYRGATERDLAAFARAEVEVEDPLRSSLSISEDRHGVGAAFARSLERG